MLHNTRVFIQGIDDHYNHKDSGGWIDLPYDEDDFDDFLISIGVSDGVTILDFDIYDWESDIPNIDFADLEALNEALNEFNDLHDYEQEIICAIMEYEGRSFTLQEAIDNVDHYNLMNDVEDDADLGRYYIDSIGELPDWAENYFDFEYYGRDIRMDISGDFTTYGFLERIW